MTLLAFFSILAAGLLLLTLAAALSDHLAKLEAPAPVSTQAADGEAGAGASSFGYDFDWPSECGRHRVDDPMRRSA